MKHLALTILLACIARDTNAAQWVAYEPPAGKANGKRIVLLAGDEEYRSEESMPMLGKLLSQRHGFHCTVLFSQDPGGIINPHNQTNVPGLHLLATADLAVNAFRFRELPDAEMKHIVDFLDGDDGVLVYGPDLRRDIARVVRHRRPDLVVTLSHEEVFAGGRTNQPDHRVVGLATLDAVRDAGNRWIFRELLEQEGLEPWGGVQAVLMGAANAPTHYVDVTGHLEPAIASLEAHVLYNSNLPADFPAPRELVTWVLTSSAAALGLPGVEHAMLFRRYAV